MAKEVKKITLGFILSWIFGILFLLLGVGTIGQENVVYGILIILFSAMIIPYFNKIVSDKLGFKISGGIKFALVILILIFMGLATSSSNSKSSNSDSTQTQSIAETQKITPNEPEKVYIVKTYNELWSIFSPDSTYTDLQKENIFDEEYKNKYVKWTGRVKDVDTSLFDNLILRIEHRYKGQFDYYGGDMTIYMNADQYDRLAELSKGEEVTYSAKFTRFSGFMGVEFYLEDGELIS